MSWALASEIARVVLGFSILAYAVVLYRGRNK